MSEKKKSNQLDEKQISFVEKRLASQKALAEAILKKHGGIITSGAASYKPIHRLSTGSFSLDVATNGGIPIGYITKIHGKESSGKTTICMKIIADAQKRSVFTNKYLFEEEDPDKRVPFSALYIDLEGTFNNDWAQKNGVDLEKLHIIRPSTAEEAGDTLIAALRSGTYDIIFLDSLAQMISQKEFDSSLEDQNIGASAKMNAKLFKQIQSSINESSKTRPEILPPTVVIINQQRANVGVMYGPKYIEPGGEAQKFYVSLNIKLSGNKITFFDPKECTLPKYTTISYVIEKNKTGAPKIEGEFDMAVADDPDGDFKNGDILDHKQVIDYAENLGFLTKDGSKWKMFNETFDTKGALVDKWFYQKENYLFVKREILKVIQEKQ